MSDKSYPCTIDYIQNYILLDYKNQCDFVRDACDGVDGSMFLKLYYCDINSSTLMLFIFAIVFCFIAFHLLSSTAENYLSPALTNLSNKLGLSETLAGVTLVAIGNGAPDVIVAISASQGGGSEEGGDDISFTIGSLFGAGLFVTTMCLANVLVKSGGGLQPNKNMFLRDMVFYWLGVALIIAYGIIGSIEWYQAVCFLMVYLLYIIVVIIMEHQEKRKARDQEKTEPKKLEEQETGQNIKLFTSLDLKESLLSQTEEHVLHEDQKAIKVEATQGEELLSTNQILDQAKLQQLTQMNEQNLHESVKHDHYSLTPQDIAQYKKQDDNAKKSRARAFRKLRHNLKAKMLKTQTEWQDLEFEDKVLYIWEVPADFVRNITIPPSEENWKKWQAVVSTIFSTTFFLMSGLIPSDVFDPFDSANWFIFVILLSVGLFLSIFVWKFTHSKQPPSYVWIFSTLAFITSIAWINMIANYLVEFLSFLQIITEINKVFLGMTFLAYGNSAGDYFTNGQLATMGYGNMALTACYAGQLFNLLIGFGLTMIFSASSSTMPFDLFGLKAENANTSEKIGSAIGYLVVICALINVTIVIAYSFVNKFVYGASIGNFLRLFYLVIIIGAMVMGIVSDLYKPDFQNPLAP